MNRRKHNTIKWINTEPGIFQVLVEINNLELIEVEIDMNKKTIYIPSNGQLTDITRRR